MRPVIVARLVSAESGLQVSDHGNRRGSAVPGRGERVLRVQRAQPAGFAAPLHPCGAQRGRGSIHGAGAYVRRARRDPRRDPGGAARRGHRVRVSTRTTSRSRVARWPNGSAWRPQSSICAIGGRRPSGSSSCCGVRSCTCAIADHLAVAEIRDGTGTELLTSATAAVGAACSRRQSGLEDVAAAVDGRDVVAEGADAAAHAVMATSTTCGSTVSSRQTPTAAGRASSARRWAGSPAPSAAAPRCR